MPESPESCVLSHIMMIWANSYNDTTLVPLLPHRLFWIIGKDTRGHDIWDDSLRGSWMVMNSKISILVCINMY